MESSSKSGKCKNKEVDGSVVRMTSIISRNSSTFGTTSSGAHVPCLSFGVCRRYSSTMAAVHLLLSHHLLLDVHDAELRPQEPRRRADPRLSLSILSAEPTVISSRMNMLCFNYSLTMMLGLAFLFLSFGSPSLSSPLDLIRPQTLEERTTPYFPDQPPSCPICAQNYDSINSCAQACPVFENFSMVNIILDLESSLFTALRATIDYLQPGCVHRCNKVRLHRYLPEW